MISYIWYRVLLALIQKIHRLRKDLAQFIAVGATPDPLHLVIGHDD